MTRFYGARQSGSLLHIAIDDIQFPKVSACSAENINMNTPIPSEAAVIHSALQTLTLLCRIRGIEPADLDNEVVDKLLWSSFEEYLGSGSIVADAAFARRP
jgi:hypothetical protein